MIVGIDEVGRGAWAGPLVVGAVLLGGESIDGLTDSKKLTKLRREQLDREIRQKARGIGLGWVSAKHIDQIGLTEALKLASRRAIAHIRVPYDEIVIDGTIKFLPSPKVRVMKKADLLVPSVSAASIVAKVARDAYMRHLDGIFGGYSFSSHVGYGTATHRKAIADHGVTPIHRLSYEPLQMYQPQPAKTTTKQIGDAAERIVALKLVDEGHRIIARNWRTRSCEIDIVSIKNGTLYFTEVKYRKSATFGDGLSAITAKKQQQMTFAANVFTAKHGFFGSDQMLQVASVSGQPPSIDTLLQLG